MKPSFTSASETLDDIVFANRNREYGAYDLRTSYPKTLRKAVLIGVGVFLMLFLLPTLYGKLKPKEPEWSITEYKTTAINIEQKPIIQPEKPKETPPQQSTVRSQIPEVMIDEKVEHEELPPTPEDLENANPGQETIEGTGAETDIIVPPKEEPTPEEKVIEVPLETPVWSAVEVQPEFQGGMDALRGFLLKNLKYPSAAQRSNVQGRVYLSFTVEPDGVLSNISVLRGIGFGCDEEALRVMNLMPKWKPGKQSGRAVRVRFNMPIVFALE